MPPSPGPATAEISFLLKLSVRGVLAVYPLYLGTRGYTINSTLDLDGLMVQGDMNMVKPLNLFSKDLRAVACKWLLSISHRPKPAPWSSLT